ncbi:MAG: hypothetical protein NQU41_03825 [Candidatus Methanosuratincola sp.]|nr:hypothetical protein [Candidatus Methanosuratincola sp.]
MEFGERKNAVFLLLLLIATAGCCQGGTQVLAAAHDFAIKDVYWATPSFPENRTLVVVLSYCGSSTAASLNASLDISQISADAQTQAVESSYNGTLASGDTVYLEFGFNVSSSAVAGSYLLPLRVEYLVGNTTSSFESSVRADLRGSPDIAVEPLGTTLVKGGVNAIQILVENKGDGLARNVKVAVQSQDIYLTLIGSNHFDLGALQPGASGLVTLALFAENSIGDGSAFSVTVTYDGEDGTPYTRSISVGVKAESPEEPRLAASAGTTELIAGAVNNVTLLISNNGGSAATDITVKVTPVSDRLTLIGANSFHLGDLAPGQSTGIPIQLYLDKQVYGSLRLSVSLGCSDWRNATYADTVSIGFISADPPAPLLEVSANSSSLSPNSVNHVTFIVRNIGTDSAQNVTVSLFSQSPQVAVVVGPGTSSAWEIPANGSLKAERGIFVQPGVFGAVPVYVQVQYRDRLGNYYSYTSAYGFSVAAEPEVAVSTVSTIPSPAFPGDKVVRVVCLIVNSGNYTAENVRIRMGGIPGVVEPSYAGTDRFTIPYLQVGSSVQIQFLVDIAGSAAPGYYEIPITIETASGNSTASIPLTVREKAPVSVERIYFDREVTPGARNVKVFVQLSNNGSQTAEQLRLSLVSGYITGSTSTLVGSLPGNSSKIVMMEVDVDQKVAPGSLGVDVELSWVQDGRQLSDTSYRDLPIAPTPGISPLWYAAVVVLAAILAIVFRKRLSAMVRRQ